MGSPSFDSLAIPLTFSQVDFLSSNSTPSGLAMSAA
jgi:hypothetical protein